MRLESDMPGVVGVDTGGTFTDFVFVDESGAVRVNKLPSLPADPALPVLEGVSGIAERSGCRIVHGTTVATNALLERKVAETALITTAGFEDIIEIGRQNRPSLYDIHPRKPAALIPRHLRFGVRERVLHDGTVLVPLTESEVRRAIARIKETKASTVAVCLLHSYANPVHEESIGRLLEEEGFSASLSCRVLPEFREYERTATVAVNACLMPIMEGYLQRLERGLTGARLMVMQSAGGIIPARTAAKFPVHTVLSGPAGGVIAAAHTAAQIGLDRIITFDMGGTSTDVSLYDRNFSFTTDKSIGGYPIRIRVLDIHTVGAGGGSIAFRDAGGALKVGPASAGADPGPLCYGRGSALTVTDANLFLGRIDPSFFLGGKMALYPERVGAPMAALAESLGLNVLSAAEGIITVVNSVMERAIRVISIQRGYDPRDFTLVTFGGAGGLHAVELARSLNIPRVLIPSHSGVFSALGMAVAQEVRELSRTVLMGESDLTRQELHGILDTLVSGGARELIEEGADPARISAELSLDMRYKGQSHEINVPVSENQAEAFHEFHENLYGYSMRDTAVEIVTARTRLIVNRDVREISEMRGAKAKDQDSERFRRLIFRGEWLRCGIHERAALDPGDRLDGPALVLAAHSTVFLPSGSSARVDWAGNIDIDSGALCP
jgi:N-methylhydantoinase A